MGSASTEKDQKLRQALGVSPSPNPRIQWLESVTLKPVARWLKTGDPHATIDRLFISEHVQDLRLIAAVAILISLVIVIFSCMYACFDVILWVLKHFIGDLTNYFTELVYNFYKKGPLGLARHVINALYYVLLHIGRGILIFGPLFAALGAGLTCAYQVGSARLGVVDLFACEISTLCRVAAALDTVRGHVGRFKEGPQANNSQTPDEFLTRPFTSEEDYFPVFQSNSRDLEVLEARVVAYITEFYTYMKAARDVQRALAQIKPPTRELSPPERVGRWHETSRNIVYMLYLGLESARNAVCQLVEFEPELAERIVVILISELEAYCFLCGQFAKEDARRQRILLRERDYRKLVPLLIEFVKDKANAEAREPPLGGAHWEPASVLLRELKKRYLLALPETAGQ